MPGSMTDGDPVGVIQDRDRAARLERIVQEYRRQRQQGNEGRLLKVADVGFLLEKLGAIEVEETSPPVSPRVSGDGPDTNGKWTRHRREHIEQIWKRVRGYRPNTELVASELEWRFMEALLMEPWNG